MIECVALRCLFVDHHVNYRRQEEDLAALEVDEEEAHDTDGGWLLNI